LGTPSEFTVGLLVNSPDEDPVSAESRADVVVSCGSYSTVS